MRRFISLIVVVFVAAVFTTSLVRDASSANPAVTYTKLNPTDSYLLYKATFTTALAVATVDTAVIWAGQTGKPFVMPGPKYADSTIWFQAYVVPDGGHDVATDSVAANIIFETSGTLNPAAVTESGDWKVVTTNTTAIDSNGFSAGTIDTTATGLRVLTSFAPHTNGFMPFFRFRIAEKSAKNYGEIAYTVYIAVPRVR